MVYEMSVIEVPQVRVLAIRGQRPPDDLPAFLQGCFHDLYAHLGLLGVAPAGPPFVLYHAFGPDGIDAEVCAPIRVPVEATGRLATRIVPAATVVRTLHVGPYEAIAGAYAAQTRWVEEHGYQVDGPVRERYITGPGGQAGPGDPETYRTEIDTPIMRVTVAVEVLSPGR